MKKAYDDNGQDFSPSIDEEFGRLAEERVKADPLRYYVELPVGRMADMWLRPRVENLDIDLDWWRWSAHRAQTAFAAAYGALNLAYLVVAWRWADGLAAAGMGRAGVVDGGVCGAALRAAADAR